MMCFNNLTFRVLPSLTVFAFCFFAHISFAQDGEKKDVDMYSLSLEELLEIPTTVASKSEFTQRESPAIVSVVTKQDIASWGSRDLIDVLNNIPGFSFGLDVQNVVGASMRGNWAHEGKLLVLLDGHEMNEILFSTVPFGQRFDVTQIEKIEIIRGPGSSIYGGYAEMAVVNIITQKGANLQGVKGQVTYGSVKDNYARRNTSVRFGEQKKNVDYFVSGHFNQGIRSTSSYTDIYGNTVDMKQNSALTTMNVQAGVTVKNFEANILYDDHDIETIDQFDEILYPKDKLNFGTFYARSQYNFIASDKLTITPQINYKQGTPWLSSDESPFRYQIEATRVAPAVTVNWKASDRFNMVSGIDSYIDHAKNLDKENPDHFGDGKDKVAYQNVGVFSQAYFTNAVANLTVGLRADNHSQFGSAFSPRIGVTKVLGKWHGKLLYSRAFRSPAIENVTTNENIKPERTGVAELELGYKLTRSLLITGNLFDIHISDPIIYYVDQTHPVGAYINFEKAGTRGFDLEYKFIEAWGNITANYSFYTSKGVNKAPIYSVPGKEGALLALPQHKVNVVSSFNISENIFISPSFTFLSTRFAFTGMDATTEELILSEFSPKLYTNLYITFRVLKDKMQLNAGAYDIFNEGTDYLQPYSGGHAPIKGLGREIIVRMTYQLKTNKD